MQIWFCGVIQSLWYLDIRVNVLLLFQEHLKQSDLSFVFRLQVSRPTFFFVIEHNIKLYMELYRFNFLSTPLFLNVSIKLHNFSAVLVSLVVWFLLLNRFLWVYTIRIVQHTWKYNSEMKCLTLSAVDFRFITNI